MSHPRFHALSNFSTRLALTITLVMAGFVTTGPSVHAAPAHPLQDWKLWEAYHRMIAHPSLGIKNEDVARARANVARHPWAREYAENLAKNAAPHLERLSPQWLQDMIPETTPLDRNFTPCPACRDLGKPLVPQGIWAWHPNRQDELKCTACETVFPNGKYPETVELRSTWGKPQTFTFCGTEPFTIFGRIVRPSISGNIRARKVDWMCSLARNLGELYVLTGEARYAAACRQILLRFAAVYPYYLVHSGYGDYADIDPKIAAVSLTALPKDDLSYPPLKPDRELHAGYWTAGRANGVGMEGTFVRRVAEAYDLTCTAQENGKAVYSEADCTVIERDLLLEGTILLTGDKSLNNKSMGNRTAVAMVGICTGHPELVRFGVEGFQRTVNSWFLADGGTPESSAYGIMAMEGLVDLPQAMRAYSDPPGYRDKDNQRFDNLNLYKDPKFARAWQTLYETLQGDLFFPALADSYPTTRIHPRFVEVLVANYPENPNFAAMRSEYDRAGKHLFHAPVAIYNREPDQGALDFSAPPDPRTAVNAANPGPKITFKNQLFPALRQGYMRTGDDGRESLLVLNASAWGTHHHLDSLNLYYWKQGQELLSDLGYLWDHPHRGMNVRTFAHNLVVLDEEDQVRKERGGTVDYFKDTPNVRAMGAHSQAYPQAKVYARTSALIDHGAAGSYVVDFFAVEGGKTQDYVFHGPNNEWTNGLPGVEVGAGETLYDLKGVRRLESATGLKWNLKNGQVFSAHLFPTQGQTLHWGAGWGQRDSKNADIGATLPYVVWRSRSNSLTVFPALYFASAADKPLVKDVQTARNDDGSVTMTVRTEISTDVIRFAPAGKSPSGALEITSNDGQAVRWKFQSHE